MSMQPRRIANKHPIEPQNNFEQVDKGFSLSAGTWIAHSEHNCYSVLFLFWAVTIIPAKDPNSDSKLANIITKK